MKKFEKFVLAALSTMSIAGCLADEPGAEPDQAQEPTATIAAEIKAAAAAVNYHQIVNKAYGQCMDAPGGKPNVILKLSGCTSSASQKWAFVATGAPSTYYLVNQLSGLCAEVNNGTANPGERVDQWECNGLASEQWIQSFRVVGGIAYQQYTHAGTSLCLDTVGSAGSQLMQWNCGGANDAQTWRVQ